MRKWCSSQNLNSKEDLVTPASRVSRIQAEVTQGQSPELGKRRAHWGGRKEVGEAATAGVREWPTMAQEEQQRLIHVMQELGSLLRTM